MDAQKEASYQEACNYPPFVLYDKSYYETLIGAVSSYVLKQLILKTSTYIEDIKFKIFYRPKMFDVKKLLFG